MREDDRKEFGPIRRECAHDQLVGIKTLSIPPLPISFMYSVCVSFQKYRSVITTRIKLSSTSDSKIFYTAYKGMYIAFLSGVLWNYLSLHRYSHCVPVTTIVIVL